MNSSGLDWLLEKEDPPIRFFALRDILGRSPTSKELLEAKARIRNYSPVRKVLRARTKEGHWPPKETFYTPKWTSPVWRLMLLGEIGCTPGDGVKRACERFLDLHQRDNGALTWPRAIQEARRKARHAGQNGTGE